MFYYMFSEWHHRLKAKPKSLSLHCRYSASLLAKFFFFQWYAAATECDAANQKHVWRYVWFVFWHGCRWRLSTCDKHEMDLKKKKKTPLGQLIPYLWLSSWLWSSSSPPPVTFFTITLSELFLLLCGKMAERKCVYTVILLSVCAVWPRPEISFGMLSRIKPPSSPTLFFFLISNFFFFLPTPPPHPHLLPLPPPSSCDMPPSPVTEEAGRIATVTAWLVVTLC